MRGKDKQQRPPRLGTRVTAGSILNVVKAVNASPEDGSFFLISTADIQGPLSPRAINYSLASLEIHGAIVRHRLDAASRAETIAALPVDLQKYLEAADLKGHVLLQVYPTRLQEIADLKPYPPRSSATKS